MEWETRGNHTNEIYTLDRIREIPDEIDVIHPPPDYHHRTERDFLGVRRKPAGIKGATFANPTRKREYAAIRMRDDF
jgi:hypothetical protein